MHAAWVMLCVAVAHAADAQAQSNISHADELKHITSTFSNCALLLQVHLLLHVECLYQDETSHPCNLAQQYIVGKAWSSTGRKAASTTSVQTGQP